MLSFIAYLSLTLFCGWMRFWLALISSLIQRKIFYLEHFFVCLKFHFYYKFTHTHTHRLSKTIKISFFFLLCFYLNLASFVRWNTTRYANNSIIKNSRGRIQLRKNLLLAQECFYVRLKWKTNIEKCFFLCNLLIQPSFI